MFRNNLFLAATPSNWQQGDRDPGAFSHNAYHGRWLGDEPFDDTALDGTDACEAPGTGGRGLDTLAGYRLRADSPLRTAGLALPNNGGRDFWGDELAEDDSRVGV